MYPTIFSSNINRQFSDDSTRVTLEVPEDDDHIPTADEADPYINASFVIVRNFYFSSRRAIMKPLGLVEDVFRLVSAR